MRASYALVIPGEESAPSWGRQHEGRDCAASALLQMRIGCWEQAVQCVAEAAWGRLGARDRAFGERCAERLLGRANYLHVFLGGA